MSADYVYFFRTDTICICMGRKGTGILCVFGLHCCGGLSVLCVIHYNLHNGAVKSRWSHLWAETPENHRRCGCGGVVEGG